MALVTIKVSLNTRRMLRVLAAHWNTTIHQAASDAAWEQMKKHKLRLLVPNGKATARNGRKERK